MLQSWRRTEHLPSFFVPTPGDLTAQESLPPGICHPRQKIANARGSGPGGGLGAGGIDWRRRQQTKGKTYTPEIKVSLKTPKKNNMQANKPYISTGVRHIFAIVSSQISTIMEPSTERHLGARNNQSAIRNQVKWHKFPIQSFYYPCGNFERFVHDQSSSNRPMLFKAHACTGEISRDRFRANSLA